MVDGFPSIRSRFDFEIWSTGTLIPSQFNHCTGTILEKRRFQISWWKVSKVVEKHSFLWKRRPGHNSYSRRQNGKISLDHWRTHWQSSLDQLLVIIKSKTWLSLWVGEEICQVTEVKRLKKRSLQNLGVALVRHINKKIKVTSYYQIT